MNSIKKKLALTLIALVTICALLMPGFETPALAYSSYPLQPGDTEIDNALDYLRGMQQEDGNIGGFTTSAWVIMAIAAAGEDPHSWKTASTDPSIVDYLRDNSNLIDSAVATDWERSILAIVAAGEDPSDFGGVDYVEALKELYDGTQIGDDGTLNDDFWGILALISAGESPDSTIIQSSADFIKGWQNENGGWNWVVGDYSDIDDTGAAIMALIAAGEALQSSIIREGLQFLIASQNDDGGFPWMRPGESDSASTSWAIGAIVAAGEDPSSPDWGSRTGETPIDSLLSLQNTEGAFERTAGATQSPEWMTAYAIPALMGKPYPIEVLLPTIAFSPSNFSLTATEGETDPADKKLKIWNSGTGTLGWSVSDNADWLVLGPTSGSSAGEEDKVTVSVDISDMDAGDYDATITIQDPEASNSPRTVTVSLEIDEPSTETRIAFSLSDSIFTAATSGANPSDRKLKIWNSGTGTLGWSVSDNADWLTLSPTSGSSTGEKDKTTISVDISGMTTGSYDATITIRSSEASNNPRTIMVSLEIGNNPSHNTLTTSVNPANSGSISSDIPQPSEGYVTDTELKLTATPSTGYAFACWTGGVDGSANPSSLTISSAKSVTANFVPFDTGDMVNVQLVKAGTKVTSISLNSYPVEDLRNIPADLDIQLACVVNPEGSGSFSLRFANIPNASSIKAYKVTTTTCVEIEGVTVSDNAVELTMKVADPIIVLAFPASTGIQSFLDKLDIAGLGVTGKISIAIIIALVAAIVLVLRRIKREA